MYNLNVGRSHNVLNISNLVGTIQIKDAVRVATIATGTLSTAFANGQTVDGIALVTADRILLKNQTDGIENGVYIVNASGSPTRAQEFAAGIAVASYLVFVRQGTVNADSGWIVTNNSLTDVVGTDALVFRCFSFSTNPNAFDSSTYMGTLRVTYNFAVNGGAVSTIQLAQSLPDNAVVTRGYYDVITPFTGNAGSTIAIGINTDDTAGLLAADVIGTHGTAGYHTCIQTGTVANFSEKTTAARAIEFTIGAFAITAGKLVIFLEYIVSD